ncbi:MAG: hydrogenase maturation protease [Bryobacteraceae bacterium]
MKPTLVVGLGNPLMGDEGIGWHLVARLAGDPRLPPDVEIMWGGTDLLACWDWFEGRQRIVLIDALEGENPGRVSRCSLDQMDVRNGCSHRLSAAAALLLYAGGCAAPPEMQLIGVEIGHVWVGFGLTPVVSASITHAVQVVLGCLREKGQRELKFTPAR